VYGLLGPNGAGKTTLIRVLTTLLRPASGSARVAGIDVLAEPTRARAHIGLAGQFAAIDEYQTGRENVVMVGRLYGLSGREAKRRADEILERIHLTDAANRRVGTYSGGMRRRLDLAASLVGRPQVMFLDEPTTGIDPRSRQDLWDLVHDLVDAGTTVLLTTQYLEEADRLCERIGVIDDGRLITEGTSSELKDQLGTGVVEVGVDEPDRATVVEIMSSLGEDDAFWDGNRERVRLTAREGTRTLMAVTRTLDARGIEPHDISIHRPTLDDVFLALTGDSPSSEPGENESDHLRGRRGRRSHRKASA
jgi:daunorubicin resistance ABC transporter ATP-binding subunit